MSNRKKRRKTRGNKLHLTKGYRRVSPVRITAMMRYGMRYGMPLGWRPGW